MSGMVVMNLSEIVMKLNGPIHAIGEHNGDRYRHQNLVNLIALVDFLLHEISNQTGNADRQEASMRAIGEEAQKYLFSLEERLAQDDI